MLKNMGVDLGCTAQLSTKKTAEGFTTHSHLRIGHQITSSYNPSLSSNYTLSTMKKALMKRSNQHFYYYYYLPVVLQAQKMMTFHLETQGKECEMGHSTKAKRSNIFTEGRLSVEIPFGQENPFSLTQPTIKEAISINSTYSPLLEIDK